MKTSENKSSHSVSSEAGGSATHFVKKYYNPDEFAALFPHVKKSRIMNLVWTRGFEPEVRGSRGTGNLTYFGIHDIYKFQQFLLAEQNFKIAAKNLKE